MSGGGRRSRTLDPKVGGSVAFFYTEEEMAIETTYTLARANLAKLLDEVTENRETVVIHRRGSEDVALIAASELRSLHETAQLLRSHRPPDFR
jgi:prevent-host-death family protein